MQNRKLRIGIVVGEVSGDTLGAQLMRRFREQGIDAESEERMLLGTLLEDSVLNFFERKLGISITNRNVAVKEGLNGMIRYKVDGSTIYGGEDATVECKVSNSASGIFTKSLGYIIQCQLYMPLGRLS